MADYSSKDAGNLNSFLQSMAPEFSIYTYSMLNAGVDKDLIRCLSEEQLVNECGITNSIHRLRILESIRSKFPLLDFDARKINREKAKLTFLLQLCKAARIIPSRRVWISL